MAKRAGIDSNSAHVASSDLHEDGNIEDGESPPGVSTEKVQHLEAEIERLRNRQRLAQRTRYRRLGVALAIIGMGTLVAGWYFPTAQEILFAFGGTGLFAAALLYYLSPEQLVPAATGELVYTALAGNQAAITSELGLHDTTVYVPRSVGDSPAVSLFVPQHPDFSLPDEENLTSVFVVTEAESSRGISLRPSASDLLANYVSAGSSTLRSEPGPLVDQLAYGLLSTYGIVDSVATSVNSASGQANVGIAGSSYGSVARFDNPVQSFLATGLARGLNTPVTVEVSKSDRKGYDHIVTCRWSPTEV